MPNAAAISLKSYVAGLNYGVFPPSSFEHCEQETDQSEAPEDMTSPQSPTQIPAVPQRILKQDPIKGFKVQWRADPKAEFNRRPSWVSGDTLSPELLAEWRTHNQARERRRRESSFTEEAQHWKQKKKKITRAGSYGGVSELEDVADPARSTGSKGDVKGKGKERAAISPETGDGYLAPSTPSPGSTSDEPEELPQDRKRRAGGAAYERAAKRRKASSSFMKTTTVIDLEDDAVDEYREAQPEETDFQRGARQSPRIGSPEVVMTRTTEQGKPRSSRLPAAGPNIHSINGEASQNSRESDQSNISHISDSQPRADSSMAAGSSGETKQSDERPMPLVEVSRSATADQVTADGRVMRPVLVPDPSVFMRNEASTAAASSPPRRASPLRSKHMTSPIETSSQMPQAGHESIPPAPLRRKVGQSKPLPGTAWAKSQPFGRIARVASPASSQAAEDEAREEAANEGTSYDHDDTEPVPEKSPTQEDFGLGPTRLPGAVLATASPNLANIESLRARVLELKNVVSDQQKALDTQQKATLDLQELAGELQTQLDAKDSTIKKLERSLTVARNADSEYRADAQARITALQLALVAEEKRADSLAKTGDEGAQAASELQSHKQAMEIALADADAKIIASSKDLAAERARREKVEADLTAAHQSRDHLVEEARQNSREYTDLRSSLSQHQQLLQGAQLRFELERERIQIFEAQWQVASRAADERGAQVKSLEAELTRVRKQLDIGLLQVRLHGEATLKAAKMDANRAASQARLAQEAMQPLLKHLEAEKARSDRLQTDLRDLQMAYDLLDHDYMTQRLRNGSPKSGSDPFEPPKATINTILAEADEEQDEDSDFQSEEDSEVSEDDSMSPDGSDQEMADLEESLEDVFYCQWTKPDGTLCAEPRLDIGALIGHATQHATSDDAWVDAK